MISNADVVERLRSLIGQELSSNILHETIFCEAKHQKVLRRFHLGKYTYLEYKIKEQDGIDTPSSFVDISITGNPNTFRMGVENKDGKLIITSEPRVSYVYI